MKNWIRKAASILVAPERLNDTWLYQSYVRWRFPAYWRNQKADRNFYKRVFSKVGSELVFDVGANAGHKAVVFAEYSKKVVCVEPDPTCVAFLKSRFANRSQIVVVEKGVANCEGELEFKQWSDGSAFNTFSDKWVGNREVSIGMRAQKIVKVRTTTLDQLITQFGQPNLIKIDVEGFELQVLQGLSTSIPYITFECNLPIFEQETLKCIALLQELSPQYRFNWTGLDSACYGESCWLDAVGISNIVHCNKSGYLEIHCSKHESV